MPIIYMNGTSPQDLRDGYLIAREAVEAAIEAATKVEFNARDYYPEPGLWDKAVKEHRQRLEQLRSISEDFLAIAGHCQDAVDERERRRTR